MHCKLIIEFLSVPKVSQNILVHYKRPDPDGESELYQTPFPEGRFWYCPIIICTRVLGQWDTSRTLSDLSQRSDKALCCKVTTPLGLSHTRPSTLDDPHPPVDNDERALNVWEKGTGIKSLKGVNHPRGAMYFARTAYNGSIKKSQALDGNKVLNGISGGCR